jgi:outer membrane protein assembly factor BamB
MRSSLIFFVCLIGVAIAVTSVEIVGACRARHDESLARAEGAEIVPAKTDTSARNWSNWRGPEQTGVSRERDLPDKWSPDPKVANNNLIWSVPYGGITTPIIQNGRVYIINKVGQGVGQQERVMCFNEADGKLLHEVKFNVWLTGIVRDRLGFTSLAGDPETGNVYAHTTSGMFFCFDKDLKVLWSHSLTEEYGRVSGYGGRLTSPIVDGDLVIVGMLNGSWGEMAIGGNRFVAFDKKTGDVVWWGSTGVRVSDTYSSSPVVAVINGERLLISGGFGGVYAFKVRTGEKVWGFPICDGAVNCDPVVDGNLVYIGHGEENKFNGTQGSVVCLDASQVKDGKPKLVWREDGIKAKFASPIIHDGRLYICTVSAVMFCLDAKTGEEKWNRQYGENSKGSPVWADGKIYVGDVDGKFHILKPKEDACDELNVQAFPAYDGVPTEVNGSPAIVNGRIYFLTTHDFYCLGKKDHSVKSDPLPAATKEESPAKEAKPTHLQIVPADVLLTPGASQAFKVYAFDDHGRALGAVKADWSLGPMKPPVYPPGIAAPPPPAPGTAGPPDLKGTLESEHGESTKLAIPAAPPLQFGDVIAKVGDLKAEARVRVTPRLPFVADFSKVPEGRTPAGWVNAQGKFAMVKFDGKPVLMKRNDNANILVARAEAYIGAPNLTDYTIQSDVYGTKVKTDMPDIAVGNCRYSLELVGNDQIVKLHTWDAQSRLVKEAKFAWKPQTWYTMKLKVSQAGDKALVQGKVWPRGESEPADWTIVCEDPYPVTEGAPFLYGFSTGIVDAKNPGCVIYYDNVKITPNK